jgi:hypothetical protein
MAVTAQAGILSWGPQAAKETEATTFYRHRAVDIDLSILDDVRLGQLEVGGTPIPTFPYKAGVMVGGGFTIQPRLKDTLGWLLYGALGKCTTSAADDNPSGGSVKQHVFEMDSSAPAYVPWMSFRKYIPPKGSDLTTDLGERYVDCKITQLGMESGTDTPLTSRVDVTGRTFVLDDAASDWTYANDYEDYQSIPVACQTGGFIKVAGVELPVVAARFGWQNQPLDPRQEHVIGDPFLEDVTILTRSFNYDITVKWSDPTLYRKVLTGDASGTAWSARPFTASFDIKLLSSEDVTGYTGYPYSLRVEGDKLMMQQVGGVRLAAGQAIMMRFQGQAIEGGANYAKFTLKNLVTGYTWPS